MATSKTAKKLTKLEFALQAVKNMRKQLKQDKDRHSNDNKEHVAQLGRVRSEIENKEGIIDELEGQVANLKSQLEALHAAKSNHKKRLRDYFQAVRTAQHLLETASRVKYNVWPWPRFNEFPGKDQEDFGKLPEEVRFLFEVFRVLDRVNSPNQPEISIAQVDNRDIFGNHR